MFSKSKRLVRAAAIAAVLVLVVRGGLHAQEGDRHIRHVLLLSVDGMHEVDLRLWISNHPGGALAALAQRGNTYSQAYASAPVPRRPTRRTLTKASTT